MLTASPSQRIDKLRETSTTLKVLRRIARIHLISLGTEKVNLQLAVQADELALIRTDIQILLVGLVVP